VAIVPSPILEIKSENLRARHQRGEAASLSAKYQFKLYGSEGALFQGAEVT
jgi:hypothetical protein